MSDERLPQPGIESEAPVRLAAVAEHLDNEELFPNYDHIAAKTLLQQLIASVRTVNLDGDEAQVFTGNAQSDINQPVKTVVVIDRGPVVRNAVIFSSAAFDPEFVLDTPLDELSRHKNFYPRGPEALAIFLIQQTSVSKVEAGRSRETIVPRNKLL